MPQRYCPFHSVCLESLFKDMYRSHCLTPPRPPDLCSRVNFSMMLSWTILLKFNSWHCISLMPSAALFYSMAYCNITPNTQTLSLLYLFVCCLSLSSRTYDPWVYTLWPLCWELHAGHFVQCQGLKNTFKINKELKSYVWIGTICSPGCCLPSHILSTNGILIDTQSFFLFHY